jgi:hypothetical protein
LQTRIDADQQAFVATLREQASAQRLARKLLHRLSQTLAFALLCEASISAQHNGDRRQAYSAWRYFELIEPPTFGVEDAAARQSVLQALMEKAPQR